MAAVPKCRPLNSDLYDILLTDNQTHGRRQLRKRTLKEYNGLNKMYGDLELDDSKSFVRAPPRRGNSAGRRSSRRIAQNRLVNESESGDDYSSDDLTVEEDSRPMRQMYSRQAKTAAAVTPTSAPEGERSLYPRRAKRRAANLKEESMSLTPSPSASPSPPPKRIKTEPGSGEDDTRDFITIDDDPEIPGKKSSKQSRRRAMDRERCSAEPTGFAEQWKELYDELEDDAELESKSHTANSVISNKAQTGLEAGKDLGDFSLRHQKSRSRPSSGLDMTGGRSEASVSRKERLQPYQPHPQSIQSTARNSGGVVDSPLTNSTGGDHQRSRVSNNNLEPAGTGRHGNHHTSSARDRHQIEPAQHNGRVVLKLPKTMAAPDNVRSQQLAFPNPFRQPSSNRSDPSASQIVGDRRGSSVHMDLPADSRSSSATSVSMRFQSSNLTRSGNMSKQDIEVPRNTNRKRSSGMHSSSSEVPDQGHSTSQVATMVEASAPKSRDQGDARGGSVPVKPTCEKGLTSEAPTRKAALPAGGKTLTHEPKGAMIDDDPSVSAIAHLWDNYEGSLSEEDLLHAADHLGAHDKATLYMRLANNKLVQQKWLLAAVIVRKG